MKKIDIPKDKLIELYFNQKLPYSAIAKIFQCSITTIFERMQRFNLKARDMSEVKTIYLKKDFSGNLIEKAYLIGFRLGDLNVTESGFLVKVKTNTTKTEQVNLLKGMFEKYTHVHIRHYKNKFFNVECGLNRSFSFLVPKQDKIENWILNNNNYFISFLAGYIDAEGNIGVYSKRARIRIGTYDKNILSAIHTRLIFMRIKNTFRLESPKGTRNQNGDYWRVCINKMEDILELFKLIKPYLKHPKRWKDLKKAEENILSRIMRDKDA